MAPTNTRITPAVLRTILMFALEDHEPLDARNDKFRSTAWLLLHHFRFPRLFERLPICSDDADFFPVKPRKLYRHPEQRILFILVVSSKRILMDNNRVIV